MRVAILLWLATVSGAYSYLLFQNKARVERDVKSGVLKIQMGEDITGPSYQIAASGVFGFILALLASVFLAVALSQIGNAA